MILRFDLLRAQQQHAKKCFVNGNIAKPVSMPSMRILELRSCRAEIIGNDFADPDERNSILR
jgi:hypothetical protein